MAPALHCERGGHRELPYPPRGVNFSVFQLRQKDPVPRGTMHEFSISPKRNELKVAENAFMNATEALPGTIRELEASGFGLRLTTSVPVFLATPFVAFANVADRSMSLHLLLAIFSPI